MRAVKLTGPRQRAYAKAQIDTAPDGWVMRLSEPTRSLDQNARMWVMLTDLSVQKVGGIVATPEDWKALVMHAAGFECQHMEGLDGRPFPVGFRSSRLTVKQMSALIDWMLAYGAEQGVVWSEEMPA